MRKIFIATAAIALFSLTISSCRSSKQSPDYDQVDKDFKDFKERNPD